MIIASPMTLTFIQRHKYASNLTTFFNLQRLGQYLSYYIQTWRDGRLMDAIIYARFDDLDLGARSQWVSKGKKSVLNALGN